MYNKAIHFPIIIALLNADAFMILYTYIILCVYNFSIRFMLLSYSDLPVRYTSLLFTTKLLPAAEHLTLEPSSE